VRRRAVRSSVDALAGVEDARLRERADDLLDLEGGARVARRGGARAHDVPEGSVVVASELLPSRLRRSTRRASRASASLGGATSHVAIMAAAAGVPMIVAAGPSIMTIAPARGCSSTRRPGGCGSTRRRRCANRRGGGEARRARTRRIASQRRRVPDCRRRADRILANVRSATEAETAVRDSAEGCGLLRTEFLLEQHRARRGRAGREYRRVVDAFGGRPVVIRTLDVGGDKRSTTCRCRARTTRRSACAACA
jgi:phosphocarrier protein FPr/phosphocarrier protein